MAMELIILMGLQASGKSTYYRTRFAATHVYVSKDQLRNNRQPVRRQTRLIEEALQARRSVVVDNTNATLADREQLIQLGRTNGAVIIGYYFATPVRESLERNRARQGRERMPDVAIYATAKRLVPPTYAEGFDRLYVCRITGDQTFECRDPSTVTSWKDVMPDCCKPR
jgi:predicted kinase